MFLFSNVGGVNFALEYAIGMVQVNQEGLRDLVIDREKWRGIVRQAKAHSRL
jgi:hypothetical protein